MKSDLADILSESDIYTIIQQLEKYAKQKRHILAINEGAAQ